VFNKRALCVEESAHILFDESNSFVEHDVQDEEFELGLIRKDASFPQNSMVENVKSPEGETRVGSENLKGGQERLSTAPPTQ